MIDIATLDGVGFGELIEPHRRELQVHCYRMMGTLQDAEDMVQETFLRAWRKRDSYAGRASLRAWLYKIATNACLDALKKASRRSVPRTYDAVASADAPIAPEIHDPIWLGPYPDDLLPADDHSPDKLMVEREDISLAFMAVLHLLPPRQRAVLILRDVLNWRASEVAELLDTSVSAVKSALHRARATLADYEDELSRADTVTLDAHAQAQLEAYMQAWQRADVETLVKLLADDAIFSMPPIPSWYRGREEIRRLVGGHMFAGDAAGRWHLVPTRANKQIAFAVYRRAEDRTYYTAYGIQMLTFRAGEIADIITFREPGLVTHFGLPAQTTP